MGKAIWVAVILGLCVSVAIAAGPAVVQDPVQASMLVTGTIDIEPDGSVSDYRIDQEKTPAEVLALLAKAVPSWKFEPVLEAGQPVRVTAKTSIHVVATPEDEDNYAIRVSAANFGAYGDPDAPTRRRMIPPSYPRDMAARGARGTVYLVLRIGKDGHVQDAIAEQVNLRTRGSELTMRLMREQFAESALKAARKWTFNPPVSGPDADAEEWSVRVPVDFLLHRESTTKNGTWATYLPGPRQPIPWKSGKDADVSPSPDALVGGGVYSSENRGPRLLTALSPD